MARPLRIEFAGACYHVINRGNYRRDLFTGKGAAEAFERTLDEAARKFSWAVHAYAVMGNHFHLAVELGEPNLGAGMQWLQSTWVRRYNGFRRIIGRPFQGRYKALLVEPGHVLGQVCHYIHLNPVRAKLVAPEKAAEYPWSSLPKFAAKERPAWLEPATVLEEAGGLADTAAGWRKYGEYLDFLATDAPSQREFAAEKMSRGWCLGTAKFLGEMRKEANALGMRFDLERFAGVEPEHIQAEREELWNEQLAATARAAGIDLAKLPPKKSAESKVLVAAALKRTGTMPNRWLAERLGMGEPASVSQFVRRWKLDPKRRAEIERLVGRVGRAGADR